MTCSGDCGFLAANLYAKSVFGEDALVNLSVEKGADGKLAGYIRIRCSLSAWLETPIDSPWSLISALWVDWPEMHAFVSCGDCHGLGG